MEHLLRIEHIGIAVSDLAKAEAIYEQLLGSLSYKREVVAAEGVITSFFKVGPNKIELLESTDPGGPIAKAIEKRGEGIHHIAFEVADIRAEMERLKQQGFQLLSEEPRQGADNKLICFVHPRSANGVLVELCQDISAQHAVSTMAEQHPIEGTVAGAKAEEEIEPEAV